MARNEVIVYDDSRVSGNLWKLFAFSVLYWIVFWQPIIVIYWLQNGCTLSQIYIIKSIHALTIIILELPSGVFADRFGKRISLFIATVAGVISLILYCVGYGFTTFLMAEILAAVGTSLISGSDSAMMHSTLTRLNRRDDFNGLMGKVVSLQFITQAVSGIIGGLIANYSMDWTMFASLIAVFPSTFITFSMVEPNPAAKAESKTTYLETMFSGLKLIIQNVYVLWLTAFLALLVAYDLILLWAYQPYLEFCGIEIIYFGVIYAAFNLVAGISSRFLPSILGKLNQDYVFIFFAILMFVSVFTMSRTIHLWGFTAIFGLQIIRGVRVPVIHQKILDIVPSNKQATVLSASSFISRLVFLILSPIFGYIIEHQGIPAAFEYSLYVISLLFVVIFIFYFTSIKKRIAKIES